MGPPHPGLDLRGLRGADRRRARIPPPARSAGAATLAQEKDVLDTWFSSGLFPFSTLGWPEKTRDLQRYYPNDVMMTGFDIIFFWVARMIMLGLRFMGDVPFRTVFINGLVRDEKGRRCRRPRGTTSIPSSSSDGTAPTPCASPWSPWPRPGTDPSLGEPRLLGYKAFVNKLWNASRFVLMNLRGRARAGATIPPRLPLASRWILSRLAGGGADA